MLEKDLTFWIDPLDGSSGLAEGHTRHLTCIIGVSLNKRPLLGVVHKPFIEEEPDIDGKTYVGVPESGLFFINHKKRGSHEKIFEGEPHFIPPFGRDNRIDRHLFKPKICGSHNKNQELLNRIFESTHYESIERVAGSANKFIHMVEG